MFYKCYLVLLICFFVQFHLLYDVRMRSITLLKLFQKSKKNSQKNNKTKKQLTAGIAM